MPKLNLSEKKIDTLLFETKAYDDENYIIRGVFSVGTEDRQGEVIDQNGWHLEEFMLNPVILFAHDHWQPAIGKAIELKQTSLGLEGAIKFAAEEYEFAKTIYNLYKGGYMKAFSVGFMTNYDRIDTIDGVDILRENYLYEISAVNVGAHAMALAYSKGIDISPLQKAIREHRKSKCLFCGKEITGEKNYCDENCEKEHKEKSAIEIISQANIETIKAAKEKIDEVLKAAGADNQDGNKGQKPLATKGGTKKISLKLLNQAIRGLLEAKHNIN